MYLQRFNHNDFPQLQTNNGSNYPPVGRRESRTGNSPWTEEFWWHRASRGSSLRRFARGATAVDIATLATPVGFLRGRNFRPRGSHRIYEGGYFVDRIDEQRGFVAFVKRKNEKKGKKRGRGSSKWAYEDNRSWKFWLKNNVNAIMAWYSMIVHFQDSYICQIFRFDEAFIKDA